MTTCDYCDNDLLPDGTCPECDYETYAPRFCRRCGAEFQVGEWIVDDLCAWCCDEDWWEEAGEA